MNEGLTAGQRSALALEAGGTAADAAAHEVNHANVRLAKVIRERAPEVYERLLRGEVGIAKGYKLACGGDEPPAHPAAAIFPMHSAEERERLKASLERSGYLKEETPVIVHSDGRIIDGRNRASVCLELGLEYPTAVYDRPDETILDYVLSKNLARRHLDTTQRAIVAAKMANLLSGQRKSTSSANRRSTTVSHADAAKTMNVGVRTVERAAAALKAAKSDPIVAQMVKDMEEGKKKLEQVSRAIGKPNRKSPTPIGSNSKRSTAPAPSSGKRTGSATPRSGRDGPDAEPPKPYEPKNRVENLALQFSNLINALDDMAREIGPDELLAGFPVQYVKNLDLSLEGATAFLSSVSSLRSTVGTKGNTAGETAVLSNGHSQ